MIPRGAGRARGTQWCASSPRSPLGPSSPARLNRTRWPPDEGCSGFHSTVPDGCDGRFVRGWWLGICRRRGRLLAGATSSNGARGRRLAQRSLESVETWRRTCVLRNSPHCCSGESLRRGCLARGSRLFSTSVYVRPRGRGGRPWTRPNAWGENPRAWHVDDRPTICSFDRRRSRSLSDRSGPFR